MSTTVSGARGIATRSRGWFRHALPQKLILLLLAASVLIYPSGLWPFSVLGYQADRFTLAIIYCIIGLSVNTLMGYAGQISLGHQAFVGIGAFTAAYVATQMQMPFPIAIVIAAVLGGATAALLGFVALRIQGLYLALITLAYGALAERSIFGIQKFTGGGLGMPADRPGYISSDGAYAYLCLGVLILLLLIDWRMMKTKFGRALLAIKSNELVASSFGMNLVFYKVAAFVIAGAIAGIGGGLFAFKNERVVSQDFTFAVALTFVIMVVVGGLGSRVGVIIGSAFTSYLPVLLDWTGNKTGFQELIVLKIAIAALLLLLTITRFPGGIAQQLHPLLVWLSGKPFPRHAHHKGQPEGDADGAS